MRGVQIFSGTSHPTLTESICERLGAVPAPAELRKFSNGETLVNIGISVRNQDVYIVQSGSSKINDSLMELLIMISACKGGSAKSITARLHLSSYFPYSRQSKKKSHRGSITARMIANLLTIAGVDHVITLDLHASQMQGFFGKPVDNLFAEPLIARWIRMHVPGWQSAVVVSKNAGGTKRVTSLADTLKLNFGLVTTDRRRPPKVNISMSDSMIFFDTIEKGNAARLHAELPTSTIHEDNQESAVDDYFLSKSADTLRPETPPSARRPSELEAADYTNDERAREVITGRLVQGHLVDDDYAEDLTQVATPVPPAGSESGDSEKMIDQMTSSIVSLNSLQPDHALGGTYDAAESDDDEANAHTRIKEERTITLVGDVKDKPVFIVDDMIDRSGSWIAAAETVVRKGGAKKVYCIATHGLFGDNSLEEMEGCNAIDHIIVTSSFPIPDDKIRRSKKLIVIDISTLLSESIRRHHYGER
ncbi:phosphoribosyltransferase-like protein [Talaromyces proteolyticus]|uniref:Ribose-phosphate pyrophosphokinase 1 n=1 Tax=Talaromyces proteolyticus TaxID=1131652 RepID=A0AAD4L3K9_9EURO|nr:phosphoribosyltransferase-like protein [Talaromyces proteolyticus]KAH8705951.1 phosphoribosyltransferase-like protein [Talaromyces proteolyticus]